MLFLIVPLTYGYMLERYIWVEFPSTEVAWYPQILCLYLKGLLIGLLLNLRSYLKVHGLVESIRE